jgi:ABC-type xylose transport system permease subunit
VGPGGSSRYQQDLLKHLLQSIATAFFFCNASLVVAFVTSTRFGSESSELVNTDFIQQFRTFHHGILQIQAFSVYVAFFFLNLNKARGMLTQCVFSMVVPIITFYAWRRLE